MHVPVFSTGGGASAEAAIETERFDPTGDS